MTNTKKTKRALLGSVIALILCLSMLVGTTFAWFTDSVVSGKNHIVAGNLDVELEYLVDGEWVAVDESTNIFGDSLWEPGHTEVVNLRVSNVGTLALKYQMAINIAEEKLSVNVNGDELKLSDYIKFGITNEEITDRESAVAAVTDSAKLISEGYAAGEKALKPNESEEITLVVYMPGEVGNEANYKTGYEAPEITLGINLMATQLVYENDSFGNDYDADATISMFPNAIVNRLAVAPTVPMSNLTGSMPSTNGQTQDLDVAYSFKTTETWNEANEGAYGKYHADFVVSFDKDVAANTVALGGYYESWCSQYYNNQWLAFEIPVDVAAGEQFRLLDTAGISMNYEELCLLVKEFLCGAANLDAANNGTTMTVELRLYEVKDKAESETNSWNEETGVSHVLGTYTYTFKDYAGLPTAVVTDADQYENTAIAWGSYGQWSPSNADQQLEAAYVFQSTDTAATVQNSPYADWNCDFYVSIDRDIEAGDLFLGGNYGSYGWVGFENPQAVSANTEVPLLGSVTTIPWTYEDVVTQVGTFTCGVAHLNDSLEGATFTVMLRLTNPEDPTDFYNVSITNYTFA